MIHSTVRFFLGLAVAIVAVAETSVPGVARAMMVAAGVWHMVDGVMMASHILAARKSPPPRSF